MLAMDREELIRRYEQKEIGRDEFVRKLIETGVSPAEAEGYADSIGFGSMMSGAPLAASAPMATSGGPEETTPPAGPPPAGWWGRLGFWQRIALFGGPLILVLVLAFWLCTQRGDPRMVVGYGPGEGPGPEEAPRLVFPFPLVTYGKILGLSELPQTVEDGQPGCKENKPGAKATLCTPQMDIQRMHPFVVPLQDAHVERLFGRSGTFPCGMSADGWFTVCGSEKPPKPGPMLIVAMQLKGGFDAQPPPPNERFFNPGVVIDGDGNASNNLVAPKETPDDFSQGSDFAVSMVPTGAQGGEARWQIYAGLPVRQYRMVPTRTRAVIQEDWVTFFIPGEHFSVETPGLRATAFGAADDFKKTGGDVLPGPPDRPWELLIPRMLQTSAVVEEPTDGEPGGDTAMVEAYVEDFTEAVRTGDEMFLFRTLHPEVLEVYGKQQCRTHLADFQDPDLRWDTLKILGPDVYDYDPDGLTRPVDQVYTVRVRRADDTTDEVHFGKVAAGIAWFTDCGQPR